MKTLLIILATMGMAAGALAQGKVSVINNNTHLLTYSSVASDLKPTDLALAGTAVASPVSPGNTWMMELWGNPSTSATEAMLVKLSGSLAAGAPVAGRSTASASICQLAIPVGQPPPRLRIHSIFVSGKRRQQTTRPTRPRYKVGWRTWQKRRFSL